MIGATLTNPEFQSYVVSNCARGYMEPPPSQRFASVQTPNVITSCATVSELLKVTGVTLIQKLMSDDFKMTEYTHLLALEDPLALNFDLTKVHERDWKQVDPEIWNDPNFRIFDKPRVIPRKEWQSKPHPLQEFFNPEDKQVVCHICGNKGHKGENCLEAYLPPEEIGLYTPFQLCLYYYLDSLPTQSPLPYCTDPTYVDKVLPELHRRVKVFKDGWYEAVANFPLTVDNPEQLFDVHTHLGGLHRCLHWTWARGAAKWELQRHAFGGRHVQKLPPEFPGIQFCDFVNPDGTAGYHPIPEAFDEIDRKELQRRNLELVPEGGAQVLISRFRPERFLTVRALQHPTSDFLFKCRISRQF